MVEKSKSLHEQVADFIKQSIESGTYKAGERIPSVREMSRQIGASITTVVEAYAHLESDGFLEARPRSGYYVRSRSRWERHPGADDFDLAPTEVKFMALWQQIMKDSQRSGVIQLSSGVPDYDLFPAQKLGLCHARVLRRIGRRAIEYDTTQGSPALRTQIAKRAVAGGSMISPGDVTVTTGCVQAVTFALRATCKAGDVVAIESPAFFAYLQVMERLGLRALEIPSHPTDGMNVDVLRYALQQTKVAACLVVPSFSNPLGSCMPLENRQELVSLMAEHEIPIIEDDTYGELYHGKERPRPLKSLDRNGMVLYCSSVSKTLAPGYRVGWVAAGRYQAELESLKFLYTFCCPTSAQEAVAEFLAGSDYDRHLRTFRDTLAQRVAIMCDFVQRYFPPGTHVYRPQGGFRVWVQLPSNADSLTLYRNAIDEGIQIMPGYICSTSSRYKNHIMLNGTCTSDAALASVQRLGKILQRLIQNIPA